MEDPAQKLHSQGVHIFAIGRCYFISTPVVCTGKIFNLAICSVYLGVKSADTNELAQISSQPTRDFTSFVGDFKVLNTLLPLVSPRVCSKAGGVYASDGMFKKVTVIPFISGFN